MPIHVSLSLSRLGLPGCYLLSVYSHLYFGGKNRGKCQISDEYSNNERIWLDEMHILVGGKRCGEVAYEKNYTIF
jgi:hypothetical protein